ncbi:MAG: DNA recombination protein RmuC [Candidatus Niyogibacteria bacterium]|nr:DNA recombination protein RmuC [Candidatus Niyogibacteria bacterium]
MGVFFAILGVIGAILGPLILFLFMKKRAPQGGEALTLLQNQIGELARTLDNRLGESTRAIQTHFGASTDIIRDVTERLTKLDETNRQVIGFADQLRNLQDILKNPKQRGILGEYFLENVLKNVLGVKHYQMQYKFADGEIVDAAIFLDKGKVLPVDSKFSLENYNRLLDTHDPAEREPIERAFKQDLKNRIDETSKYIRPSEGTMDFAFMFIPSEAIYYDLLSNQVGATHTRARDLIEYAFNEKHVIIVSPTSFLAYLQTVLQGLRSLQIEESAKEIRKRVEELGRHIKSYDEFSKRLGTNLITTVNAYNASQKELGKIDKDVFRITGEDIGIEPQLVDKPELEE